MSETGGRRIYYLAAIAIVAIVLISAIAATWPLAPVSEQPATTKTLQVSGVGTVSSAPDQALLLLAVQTQATSAADATAENAVIMSRVFDTLQGLGISKDSIATISYSLTPIYESKPDQTVPAQIIGYSARNAIQVTVSDFSLVGKALDAAVSAGANEVQGIIFTLSNAKYAELEKDAMQLALRDADSKAKSMAGALGLSLVGPISVNPGYAVVPVFEKQTAIGQATPIQPGTLQVTVNVQIVYEFA